MSKKSYSDRLKDPNWQRRRLEKLNAKNWTCERCGDKTRTLHVHHKQYFTGLDPWEYDDEQLAVLCDVCHDQVHEIDFKLREILSRVDLNPALQELEGIYWFLAGFACSKDKPESDSHKLIYQAGKKVSSQCWRENPDYEGVKS